jgi:hypothetical protein
MSVPPRRTSITLTEATLLVIAVFIILAYFTGWDQNLLK